MLGPRLNQRIRIDQKTVTQDPESGAVSTTWTTFQDEVPAEFKAGPGREFAASGTVHAEADGRFIIRYLPGVTSVMRVFWDGQVWSIIAPPILDRTARRDMTLMVKTGVLDG
ncbi:hypothetical protein DA70_09590 [Pandoraea pnomenusa]|uniref:phage head closure protein n=1 Tax=Pandoraea pnomenusa TaxID=93220 RepID=UPI000437637F|nr:phage head closure protein [Pandoraea pnomenusa]AHN74688.1 hypothetical protein DA70_09590 [Pandoraea pnomenusa]